MLYSNVCTFTSSRLFGHVRRIIGLWVAVYGHAKAIKMLVRVLSRRKYEPVSEK